MPIDLLIVGDAFDGPAEEIREITSLDQAFRLYGGYHFESVAITSGQTGYTLSLTPWANECSPYREDSDSVLIPRRLFEFTVSGSLLNWTKLGSAATIIFRVTREPGPTSLLKGILAARRTGVRVHALRLGDGAHASHAPSGQFSFISRFPGSRYNGTEIVVAPTTVTLTPAPGTGLTRTYPIGNDREFALSLRSETARGHQSVLLSGPFSTEIRTLPVGTYVLTGGTDGTLTSLLLKRFIEEHDLSGIDILCPVGLLVPDVSGALIPNLLSQNDYPTLLVCQAAPSGVALSGQVNTHQNMASVAFQVRYDAGSGKERLDDAAPLVAAIFAGSRFGLTLATLPEKPAVPRYDPPALHAMASGGHIVAYPSIAKDWALWHAVTGDRDWPVSTFRALQEIVRPIYLVLEAAIGNPFADLAEMDERLGTAFRGLTGSRVVDWDLLLQGDALYLDLSFIPYGEVRVVTCQVSLGTPQTVSPVG